MLFVLMASFQPSWECQTCKVHKDLVMKLTDWGSVEDGYQCMHRQWYVHISWSTSTLDSLNHKHICYQLLLSQNVVGYLICFQLIWHLLYQVKDRELVPCMSFWALLNIHWRTSAASKHFSALNVYPQILKILLGFVGAQLWALTSLEGGTLACCRDSDVILCK